MVDDLVSDASDLQDTDTKLQSDVPCHHHWYDSGADKPWLAYDEWMCLEEERSLGCK